MLEKRPTQGIWGGLHSLPEIDDPHLDPATYCQDYFSLEIGAINLLPEVKHGFTHFDLLVTPVVCEVTATGNFVADDQGRDWFPRQRLDSVGLPAVVSRILAELPEPWQSTN